MQLYRTYKWQTLLNYSVKSLNSRQLSMNDLQGNTYSIILFVHLLKFIVEMPLVITL